MHLHIAATQPPPPNCAPEEWMCDNGQCIHSGYRCDTYKDCEDGSDEDPRRCPPQRPSVPGNFCYDYKWSNIYDQVFHEC